MKKNKAFTLVEIFIVVFIIGLLTAIAIPAFMKARESEIKQEQNLKTIETTVNNIPTAYSLVEGPNYLTLRHENDYNITVRAYTIKHIATEKNFMVIDNVNGLAMQEIK